METVKKARRGRPRDEAARSRVLASAREQFIGQGYLRTTLSGIARAARVSVQTIYQAFGSKLGLLRAVHDLAIAGDDLPVPLSERGWFQDLSQHDSIDAAWSEAARHFTEATLRVAPVYQVIERSAADAAVGTYLQELHAQRWQTTLHLVEKLDRIDAVTLDADQVAPVLYTVTSPAIHDMLVTEGGWSRAAWQVWVRETGLAALPTS